MKTDRELLELAAKAIGLTLRYNYFGGRDANQPWDPLDDDGDALRLAAKLKMNVCLAGLPHVYADMPSCDFMADTCHRRAIVRAAAAIGSAM